MGLPCYYLSLKGVLLSKLLKFKLSLLAFVVGAHFLRSHRVCNTVRALFINNEEYTFEGKQNFACEIHFFIASPTALLLLLVACVFLTGAIS